MEKRSDFERVLMNIAVDVAGTCFDRFMRIKNGWDLKMRFDRPVAQFLPVEMAQSIDMPLQTGDIVRCRTNPHHHWGIAVFLKKLGDSDWLLQEIGRDATCEMYNEDVDVLRFMAPSRLYTGKQYQVYQWAAGKVFDERYNENATFIKRCGGVEFNNGLLIIWCRPHICAMERRGDDGSTLYAQPKKFTMPWGKGTRLKDIIQAMNDQGFGDDFEYTPEEPTEGQGGSARFTREDIERVLIER